MNRLFLLLFGVVSLVAHAQVPDYVPTEGLVAWYPFNGNANDESGNGNDGQPFGAVLTEDRYGAANSAYFFNGYNDFVDFGNVTETNALDEFTITGWFNSDNLSLWRTLISKGAWNNAFANPGWAILVTNNQLNLYLNGEWNLQTPLEISTNEWHFFSFSRNENNEFSVVFDGVVVNSGVSSDIIPESNSNTLKIGKNDGYNQNNGNYPYPYYFSGMLDDYGIWSHALTDDEILALYNSQPLFPGCTDPTACNFDAEATSDDGSCIPSGCMEPEACNYNALAECAGEACDFTCCPGPGCCLEGTVWDAELGGCIPMEVTCPEDLDFDGVVGVNDLMELLSAFGTDCPEPEEPATSEFTCGDPVSYHGYDYATVQIGEQCWFAENLRTELYQNGDSIPGELSNSDWSNTTAGAQAIPNNDASNVTDYGRLYNWYAVDDERGLCPTGWHLPTDGEWMTLEMELGMTEAQANSTGSRGTDQGTQMKSSPGDNPSWNGTNTSGFSGLPSGLRSNDGIFIAGPLSANFWNGHGFFWSTSVIDVEDAINRLLYYTDTEVYRQQRNQHEGLSVRCLKD